MGERRPLVAGIKPERSVEEAFVRSGKLLAAELPPTTEQAPAREVKAPTGNPASRAPLTTRVRADFAEALKRASLQRQLDGVTPHTLQEILEEALEPWLRKHGYIQ
jgi:cell pole-organizing protein PopZ